VQEQNKNVNDLEYWKNKADKYWQENDALKKRVVTLTKQSKVSNTSKKQTAKQRGQWDSVTTKRIASDSGLPTLLGSATWFIIIKASEDLNINYMLGLSFKGFWLDTDISTWVQSSMIMMYAATIKFFSKYDGGSKI